MTLQDEFESFVRKVDISHIGVSGDTFPLKDKLKKLGYKWSGKDWRKPYKRNLFGEYKKVEKYLQYQRTTFNIYTAKKSKEIYFACKEFGKVDRKGVILTFML